MLDTLSREAGIKVIKLYLLAILWVGYIASKMTLEFKHTSVVFDSPRSRKYFEAPSGEIFFYCFVSSLIL